jgi:hypothetical protein
VGPYDKRLPGPRSSLTWFHVEHPLGALPTADQAPEQVGCVAKALVAAPLAAAEPGWDAAAAELATLPEAALLGLAQRYVGSTAAGGSWLGGGQLGSWLGG